MRLLNWKQTGMTMQRQKATTLTNELWFLLNSMNPSVWLSILKRAPIIRGSDRPNMTTYRLQ